MNKLFKINGNDNVAIALESLAKGEKVDGVSPCLTTYLSATRYY